MSQIGFKQGVSPSMSTSVGKFDKKVLRRRYAEGDLDVETLA